MVTTGWSGRAHGSAQRARPGQSLMLESVKPLHRCLLCFLPPRCLLCVLPLHYLLGFFLSTTSLA